jgi:putative transposase
MASRRWVSGEGPARKKGAAGEAEATGRNPTDRSKCGTKRHLLTDGQGVPLACIISEANRTDMKRLGALLDAQFVTAPVVQNLDGQPIPRELCLDRGYDYDACRETAVAHGYRAHIPPKASAAQPLPPPRDPARHPARRWVVEVGHAWFNRFRRLLIRWDKKAANYLAFIQLAACLIIYRKVRHAASLSG